MCAKRQREYTPEEAMAIIMRDQIPHWYGSTPLVVGMDFEERAYPQPLDIKIKTGTWVFFFASATGPEFYRARELYRSWLRKFGRLGVQFIFAFRGHYSYFSERKSIEAWVEQQGFGGPSVCDLGGDLARAFGAMGEPAISILSQGEIVFADSGPEWISAAETKLHFVLRQESPGLPLWPVQNEEGEKLQTTDRWILREGSKNIANKQVTLQGNWNLESDRIVTSDPKAELHFVSPGTSVFLVARSLSTSGDPTRIRFDTEGSSFSDTFAGPDFATDEEGGSCVSLQGPRSYWILKGLKPDLRRLRIRFPFAKVNSVAVYGVEFGDLAGAIPTNS